MNLRKGISILMFMLIARRLGTQNCAPERSKRRYYVHPINLNRDIDSQYQRLICLMRTVDHAKHRNFFRLDPDRFDHLLSLIRPQITPKPNHRMVIPPAARLAMTLRFLASGDSFTSIGYNFHCHPVTCRQIVYQVCGALCGVLKSYLPKPTEQTWLDSAREYMSKCDFPNLAGTADGKHVRIQAGPRSGTRYRNYKNCFSIVLLGVFAADCRFLFYHIGQPGRLSDSRVLAESSFGKALITDKLNLPRPRPLPGTNISFPFVFVGDEGFPLKPNFLRPFPRALIDHTSDKQKIFNYRLSRARRVSENAFGLLTARFRVLRKQMDLYPENARLVTKTCCLMHNYLIVSSR